MVWWKQKLPWRLPGSDKGKLRELEVRIGYRFRNPRLAEKALRHRSSLVQDNLPDNDSYERLELLGDAVITLVTSEYLLQEYPDAVEGDLTKLKSLVVSGEVLSQRASKLGLGNYISMSEGELRSGGRGKPSILEDVFESLAGAIYLDGGLKAAQRFVENHLLRHTDALSNSEKHRNFKSILLEYAQSELATQPKYRVVSEEGPDHQKIYNIEASIEGKVVGAGKGTSKKRAEQQAARSALEKLGVGKKLIGH